MYTHASAILDAAEWLTSIILPSTYITHFFFYVFSTSFDWFLHSPCAFTFNLNNMLSLTSIRASNAAFTHSTSHPPVAVFVGGTSGIGEGMARTFAEHTKGNSSIIIVGRNRAAADAILASLPKPAEKDNLKVAREFIQCDVTLMKNVKNTAQDILSRHSKINYLVMSPGIMTFVGRDETPEGIDKKMAVHYYGRWTFLRELLPALEKAKDDGEDAAAMSVFGAGNGGKIDVDDLAMKKNYSTKNAALALPTYNDLMMQARS